MFRSLLGSICLGLFLVANSAAFEVQALIRSVDAEKRILEVFAGERERTVPIAQEAKVLNEAGKDLQHGLASPELKAGITVTLLLKQRDKSLEVVAIRLGGKQIAAERPANLGKSTVGFTPLSEMTAEQKYQGEEGGLYGEGRNQPPEPLREIIQNQTAKIQPLNAAGEPALDGKIGLISMSMSNATQEFSRFKQIADADADKSPWVKIVDCAQGGQTMARWAEKDSRTWQEADRRLQAAGVSENQVQVAWIKLANAGPTGSLAEHGGQLQTDTESVLQNAIDHFPHLKIAYLGSRIYGGYAETRLNPEPYAYEGAFVVRWLIRKQLRNDPALNFDAARGAVQSPLLLWGPYFWSDGTTPRKSDGLIWVREDFSGDGVHPTDSGRQKVADQLLKFFKTDIATKTWFCK